jgi:acetolactate synthase-1/2/3 large subunit
MPNQSALVAGVSAHSRTVHCPEELAPALAQAFAIFDSARPRPVHIELPINVMLADASHLPVTTTPPRLRRPAPATADIEAAAALLNGSNTPLILTGGGAVRSAAKLRDLAEALDAPVVMTTNARGILPADHPLGVSLSPSMPATRALVAASDVVLALGTELGPTDYDFYEDGGFAIPGKLIRVDIDPAQIMRSHMPSLGLVGDVDEAIARLAPLITPRPQVSGLSRARAATAGTADLPRATRANLAILNLIREILPNALIVGDSTQLVYAGNTAFAASVPGGYFNSATGFGTLGYGLPAAIGAALGAPGRPIVALVGDGGLQFTSAELASAVEAEVPIIMILHDNSGYGEIKSYMQSLGVTPLGVDILTPDLARIARACGWQTDRLEPDEPMASKLRTACDLGRPSLLIFNDQFVQDFSKVFPS